MTVDQLAAKVGMTVRNVRAYASRGLLPPPRLQGRKGFYDAAHESRLRLIRDLIDRGYTLAAVERAISENPDIAETHALDLLGMLAEPMGQVAEPEEISVAAFARLAGLGDDADADVVARVTEALEERGLVERVGDDRARLLQPALVRAGAQAMAMGLSAETVLGLFPQVRADMSDVADRFVDAVRAEVWRPFAERGMPEEEWETLIASIETIIPVAVQAVLASFRHELTLAIQRGVEAELSSLTGEQVERLFGN